MSVTIDRISFKNYRQYQSISLDFKGTATHHLTALIAQNGTGKTTFLKAITWCLYGTEYPQPLTSEEELGQLSKNIAKELTPDKIISVGVTLYVTDHDAGKTFEFIRSMDAKKAPSISGSKIIYDKSQLKVVESPLAGKENSKTHIAEDADIIVAQYFDQGIRSFYFFDGEDLSDVFASGSQVKSSVDSISQVTLLSNAANHTNKMKNDLVKEVNKNNPKYDKLKEEQEEKSSFINSAKKEQEEKSKKIIALQAERNNILEILRHAQPVRKKQEEREALEADIATLQEDLMRAEENLWDFIREYTIKLKLYPHAKKFLNIIEKESSDSSDTSIIFDPALINYVLEHPADGCPLCSGAIGHNAVTHLNELLTKAKKNTSSKVALFEMKPTLEELVSDVEDHYESMKSEAVSRVAEIKKKIQAKEDALATVNKFFSQHVDEEGNIDYGKLEKSRADVENEINSLNQQIGALNVKLQSANNRLNEIYEEIDKITEVLEVHDHYKKEIRILSSVNAHLTEIKDRIMHSVKNDVEQKTWQYFEKMAWKKNTFGSLQISDDYKVSIFDKDGVNMTGSLSAAEKMTEAYAFIFAVHEASGRNCPLVIDYPIGRASDENREFIAKALLDISEEKQFIMLFAPDEYSVEVSNQYDGTTEKLILKLNSDETAVEVS